MYMRHLALLEELFPQAQYVHLIRDGRDAALSFLEMPEGTFTRTWAHPRTPAQFACLWRKEVGDARALGRRVGPTRYLEVRYEELVADARVGRSGDLRVRRGRVRAGDARLHGSVDVSAKPHQQRLLTPPTTGVRSWREDMSAANVAAFDAVAGDLLDELGYAVGSGARSRPRAAIVRAWYDVRLAAWNVTASTVQRSPLWRRRHPRLSA